ncbi:MAG: alkyl hydroperoxide reductase [Planctomycetota bacterium]|nr:MAG: alkyl hydroperoxide reductase [Planctomycetota bacterium]
MSKRWWAVSLTAALSWNVVAKSFESPAPGHSIHGEVFNEGPRQAAYLMGDTGTVSFPITSANPEAQAFFNQGIGQLHGFWYFEAERSFRQVAMLDPNCAMAYWGMAFANIENRTRGAKFIVKATEKKASASRREQLFIDGLAEYLKDDKRKDEERRKAYIRDLEKVLLEFPDDIEAKAFLAVFLYQSKSGVPLPSQFAVDALLSEVFQKQPMHPAHHYRIHLWDHQKAEKALESAARCGQAAPRIAHMWHMPGHTYSDLKRWADSAWQQEASGRADHAHMMRDRVLPDQIHNYAHNQEWLVRNFMNLGRQKSALDLSKNLLELPRHPKNNSLTKGSGKNGHDRLLQVLEGFELWDDVVALSKTMYLEAPDATAEQSKRLLLVGVAHYHRGEFPQVEECVKQLDAIAAKLEEKAQAEAAEEEKKAREANKNDADIAKAKDEKLKNAREPIAPVEKATAELRGVQLLARGETDKAREQFDKAGDIPKLRQAKYQFLCGQHDKSVESLKAAVQSADTQVMPLAVQVDLLRRMNKLDDAKAAFAKLRDIAAHADLDSPLLARLAPFAKEQGWPDNWRNPVPPRTDVGERPTLDAIGPFRWSPSPAIDWSLPTPGEKTLSLSEYRGKSVVVIFYLGAGCLHCVEQLQKFAPRVNDFQQAGISIVGLSTEDLPSLTTAVTNFSKDTPFPIPLAADPELKTFKAYRAFDDFEKKPLHGTFLIDGAGFVRWQDISFEPFQDVDFVLHESKRLLSITR